MYIYHDIGFRPIEKADLEVLKELHNDQSTFLNLATIDLVNSNDQGVWWSSLGQNTKDQRFAIARSENPSIVLGRLRIQNIDFQNRNCEVGLDICKEYRGQGFGTKSYEMILEYLFMHYHMHMVYLRVADFNEKAKELYERIGFLQTGYLPEYLFRHGRYWNYLIMAITREKYLNREKS